MDTSIEKEKEKSVPSYQKIFLISFLYLIQGVFIAFPFTIIVTYKQIPPYGILAYFSASTLPFSFKFVIAPLIEKYTSQKYGRRKTWIVISLLVSSVLILFSSTFVESEERQIETALLWTCIIFMISIEDISTDSLAIKQLQDAQLSSYLQNLMMQIGYIFGSLFFLQLVSDEGWFAYLGMAVPIISVPQYLTFISISIFTSGILIHFFYTQKKTKKEEQGIDHSFWEVIKHYKHFVNPQYRLCRQALIFLTYQHGLTYFKSGYTVQLMKNHGYSKDVMNSVKNILIIPTMLLTWVLKKITSKYKAHYLEVYMRARFIFLLQVISCFMIFMLDITEFYAATGAMLWMGLISSTQFFMDCIIVNTISDSLFAGMYVTMMASSANLGRNGTINLKVIDYVGFDYACYFGFFYCIFSLAVFGKGVEWIKNGKQEADMVAVQKTKKD